MSRISGSDPGGSGIRATVGGNGTLTGARTGNVPGEVVILDINSSHVINVPAILSVAPVTVYHTVTYDPNGADSGDVPVDTNQYLPDGIVTIKGNEGNLQKTDHTFVGWTLEPDGSGTVYNVQDTIVMDDADIILYAKWEPVQPETEPETTQTEPKQPEPEEVPNTGQAPMSHIPIMGIFSLLVCIALLLKLRSN